MQIRNLSAFYVLDLPSFISEWGFGGILSNAAKGGSIGQLIVVCFFVFMKAPL
jgi:hypothetical protein